MRAAIDVGSNTVRMLIGSCDSRQIHSVAYHRQITRLGGGYLPGRGLAPESMERTLAALKDFDLILRAQEVTEVRAVATAALRRAENRQDFLRQVGEQTQFVLEIIDGEEEALLTACGVLSVVCPPPSSALLIDIGGGSTELILSAAGQLLLRRSYPLGVVRLCEEYRSEQDRQLAIDQLLDSFFRELEQRDIETLSSATQLLGTAGTVTTLAAMNQQLTVYDRRKINNAILSLAWLRKTIDDLRPLSVAERERLPGLEEGRGDLIVPGLQLLISLMERCSREILKVADAGLLEGVLLGLSND